MVFTIVLLVLSCQKQVVYGLDILQLKSDVALLKSSISSIRVQFKNKEASLKAKIEKDHLTIKNVVNLNNYYLPKQIEEAIGEIVEYYNHECFHES